MILLNVCVRAGMERVPELFLLPAPGMNAYALGTPDNACISVTEGLLRGLSREEIAGILAHEVAHILHHDTGAMNWAAAIQGEIVSSALRGIAELMARRERFGPPWPAGRCCSSPRPPWRVYSSSPCRGCANSPPTRWRSI